MKIIGAVHFWHCLLYLICWMCIMCFMCQRTHLWPARPCFLHNSWSLSFCFSITVGLRTIVCCSRYMSNASELWDQELSLCMMCNGRRVESSARGEKECGEQIRRRLDLRACLLARNSLWRDYFDLIKSKRLHGVKMSHWIRDTVWFFSAATRGVYCSTIFYLIPPPCRSI